MVSNQTAGRAIWVFMLAVSGGAGLTWAQTTQPDRKLARVNELASRQGGEAAEKAYRAAREQFVSLIYTLDRLAKDDAKFEHFGDWHESELIFLKLRNEVDGVVVRAWRADNEKTLKSIIEATKHPLASFRVESPTGRLADVDQAIAVKFLNVGKLALAVAAETMRTDNTQEAYAWNERALRIADHLYQQPFGLIRNAGLSLEQSALEQLAQIIARAAPPDSKALCRRLASQGRNACKAESIAEMERLYTEDWYAKIVAWAADRRKHPAIEEEMEGLRTVGATFFGTEPPYATIDDLHAAMKRSNLITALDVDARCHTVLGEWDRKPLHQALPGAQATQKRLSEIGAEDPIVQFAWGLNASLGRDIASDRRMIGCTVSMRRATAAMVALWHIRREKGVFPPRLSTAALEFGNLDVTDEFSGEPLRYRVEGEGFVLYSVGLNQKDDGGKVVDEKSVPPDDLVFWPIANEGVAK